MKRKALKKDQLCVLCGERAATTHDHIPPKCIYPKPRDNDMNLHTVPACRECNEWDSAADEVFKAIITIDTSHARGDGGVLVDLLAGTVGKNQKIANNIFGSARRVYARSGSGIFQPAVDITFEKTHYVAVVRRIVRGLYWTETREILPRSANITVFPSREIQPHVRDAFQEAMSMPYGRLGFLNKRTVAYRNLPIGEEQTSIWGICFFSSHLVFAYVKCTTGNTENSVRLAGRKPALLRDNAGAA